MLSAGGAAIEAKLSEMRRAIDRIEARHHGLRREQDIDWFIEARDRMYTTRSIARKYRERQRRYAIAVWALIFLAIFVAAEGVVL